MLSTFNHRLHHPLSYTITTCRKFITGNTIQPHTPPFKLSSTTTCSSRISTVKHSLPNTISRHTCKLSHLNITNSTILTINYIFSLHHRALYHQGNTENSLKATDEETRATDEETRAICTFYHPHNPYNLMLLKLLLLQPSPLISPIQSKSMLNNTLMEPHPLTWIS